MSMKVVFRADASLQIGTGHVMRCLTLAGALRARGASCHFICRVMPGHLIGKIRQSGFAVIELPAPPEKNRNKASDFRAEPHYLDWLGVPLLDDACQTRDALNDMQRIDWLVVDHYAIDAVWESEVRAYCRKLMVIDDLANRSHICDLLLDQNLGRAPSDYLQLVNDNCRVLAGPRYALLRPEFAEWRARSLLRRSSKPVPRHLLVTLGGVDQDDKTSQVIDFIDKYCTLDELDISVILGIHAPGFEKVKQKAAAARHKTTVLSNVDNMAELMARSDLAIGAAGGTSWERCCMGLPSIVLILAANQTDVGNALQECGCASVIPDSPLNFADTFKAAWISLENPELLHGMSESAAKIADGLGTARIAEGLSNFDA